MFIAAKQRGDTLVEVLICIAIVGAVIAGAYSLASRSLQEGVSAAEHSDAVKLAEGQIEALKLRQAGSDKDEWATYFASSDHINNTCLDLTSKTQTDTNWRPAQNGNNPTDLAVNTGGGGNYADNAAHTQCAQQNAKYFINITLATGASANPTYLVTVRWTPAGDGPTSQSQIYYRF
jgi:prepilin-type N-terminal cleavage/methylation domain-containing protein